MTTNQAPQAQVWSDLKVDKEALKELNDYGTMTLFTAKRLFYRMRDDYEAELTRHDKRIADLTSLTLRYVDEITELEKRIEALRLEKKCLRTNFIEVLQENEWLRAELAEAKATIELSLQQLAGNEITINALRADSVHLVDVAEPAITQLTQQVNALRLRVAEQEAREEWTPVEDGIYPNGNDEYEIDGEWLRTRREGETGWGCKMPTQLGWHLMRRVAKEGEVNED